MKKGVLLAILLFLSGSLILAQDCPPGETEILILPDQTQLTIYIPAGTVSLKGINFNTVFEGQPTRFYLENYPEFAVLNLESLDGPRCLYLQTGAALPVPPSQCGGLEPDHETIQRIPEDQNFWYVSGASRWSNLTVMQFAFNLGVCTNPSSECQITVPSLAIPVISSELSSNLLLSELFLTPSQIEDAEKFAFSENNGILNDSLSPECALWGDFGLQIDFDMPQGANNEQGGYGGWGVHWDYAPNGSFDAAPYRFLTFWLRADRDANFQIGMKDITGNQVQIDLENWVQAGNWEFFRVPLSRFVNAGGVDLTQIKDISLGFNQTHEQGTLCVDNISFLQEAQIVESNSPINARSAPYTSCGVLNQLNSQETIYVVSQSISGSTVNGDSGWVLAIHEGQYIYLHSSLVDFGTLPPPPPPPPTGLLIADFESGTNVNNLGFLMGAFYDPNKGDLVTESYANGQVNINYTLTANSFGGFWLQLGGADFSPYQQLTFDIVANSSFPLKVELKRSNNTEVRSVDINVGTSMQTISINLSDFGLSSLTDISELVFALEQVRSGSSGTVIIDNITLSQQTMVSQPPQGEGLPIIANFDDGTKFNNLGQEMGVFYPVGTGDSITENYENGQVTINYTLATDSYGGFWVRLGGADFSPYERLTFDISASSSFSIKVEFKHNDGSFTYQYIPVVPSMQAVSIDLAALSLSDFTNMNELVFVLEQAQVGSNGTVTIDNIVLR